jgi:hypothetical protein
VNYDPQPEVEPKADEIPDEEDLSLASRPYYLTPWVLIRRTLVVSGVGLLLAAQAAELLKATGVIR